MDNYQLNQIGVWMLAARISLVTAVVPGVGLAFSTGPANAQAAQAARDAGDPATASEPAPDGFWQRDTMTGDWGGLRTRIEDAGIKFGLQEQSEVWGNLAGGLRRGVVYDGLTTGSVTFDLEKLAGWTGATVFANAYQIHGRGPSANLVGNLQPVSSVEATRDTKLYQLWLEQALFDGRLKLRIGQAGADQMMLTQYGALFLNSSFGFPALPALDLPSGAPNFPLATPFVRAQFQAAGPITLVGAVFNGDPAPQGDGDPQLRDHGGTAFRLNDHVLAVSEIWYSVNQEDGATGLPGTYKLGVWYHSGHFADQQRDSTGRSLADPASTGVARAHSTGYAAYAVVDQMVWKQPGAKDRGLAVFLEVMGAPAGFNLVNRFVEAGMNWKGPFEARQDDSFGLAVSYIGISPAKRRLGTDVIAFTGTGSPYAASETILEATYLCQVTPWLGLQPDLQVVFNPGARIPTSAAPSPLKNDVIAGLRASITF
jgi:porin